MTNQGKPPFERRKAAEGPALVGAEWWQEGLASAANPVARRQALVALTALAGGTAVIGAGVALVAAGGGGSSSDEEVRTPDALETQRDYGWSFGAEGEALTFDGADTAPFDRSALAALADAGLPPAQARLRPFYQATLFEALRATPTKPRAEGEPPKPLVETITPLFTPAMGEAYRRGQALASLFEGKPPDAALFVDLPGPEAVAFAAGASGRFDPVFTFDNWPHPRGVVPAHLTLAALAYYQPLLARLAAGRAGSAPPAFVLDRNRLRPYTDEAAQFDNRYVAKVPGPDQLRTLGVAHALYVGPEGAPELDDLNDDFVTYAAAGVDVKTLAPSDFAPANELPLTPLPGGAVGSPAAPGGGASYDYGAPSGPSYYYGGSPASHLWFWHHYAWYPPPRPPPVPPPRVSGGYGYRPSPRPTLFRGFVGMQKPKPSNFGRVPVVYSRSSGTAYGPRFSGRSGSWGRSGGWSGSS
ncbi:MAG TPA: hypothetical protein VFS43_01810 [Polyangiaceae bacterium]|nr:hypothetical protein [Polyangiaceae bacterium]